MHFEPKKEMRTYITSVMNGLAGQKKFYFLMFVFLITIRSTLRFAPGGKGFNSTPVSSVPSELAIKKFK